jgi:hypothetical protein
MDPRQTTPLPSVPFRDDNESLTDWGEFLKAGLTPVEIICSEYRPIHTSITSCHSRIATKLALKGAPLNPATGRPTKTGSATTLLDHVKNGHGGGFLMKFRRAAPGDKIAWAGWKDLKESGVEVIDIRCEWCEQAEGRIHAGSLLSHFKPHRGRGRGMKVADSFWLTLSFKNSLEDNLESDDE